MCDCGVYFGGNEMCVSFHFLEQYIYKYNVVCEIFFV